MHKYKEHIVPCKCIDAQGSNGSIHTRHPVCMFDVDVCNRYRQMYAMQSLKRRRRRRTESALVERMERAVVSILPKKLIVRTPVKV
jgi:hypothetical protein